jgi:gliding motility-associated-like protein
MYLPKTFLVCLLALMLLGGSPHLLNAANRKGCVSVNETVEHALVVDTSIVALDPTLSCGSNTIVRLQAGMAQTYQWLRNGSAIPGATARLYNANISGSYRVRVTDGLGNLDSSRVIEVLIVPIPAVGFTTNQPVQCLSANAFTFTNTTTISQGSATYTWYYGDGSFSISTNGSRTYANAGTFSVKLVATSNYGCVDSLRQTVSVNLPPTVSFSVNNTAQCLNGNQFFFTNSSTSPQSPLTYRWEFGDGSTSTAVNPSYQYNQQGVFPVKLVVTSQAGCKDSVIQNVTVHPKPIVRYTINSNQQCQTGNYFQFTNTTSIEQGTMSYFWQFGDGVSSGVVSPAYSYLSAGTYSVKLLATSDKGCRDSLSQTVRVDPSPTALFTVNKTVDCFAEHDFVFTNASTLSTGIYTSFWDFGDGVGTSTATHTRYRYTQPGTYRVTLTVRTINNCSSTYTMNLFLNQTPSGSILPVATTVICEGSFVELKATTSSFYQWYKDGVAIAGATAGTYNATEPGTYRVEFRNSTNCTAFSSNQMTLTKVFQPTPGFDFDRSCAGLSTTFTNTSLVANSLPVSYRWLFGDGDSSFAVSPVHTYQTTGPYVIRLTVTPTQCPQLARSIQKPITVEASPAGLRYPPVNAVARRDLALRAREFSGARYRWTPATGLSTDTIATPIFNYTDSMLYQISIVTTAGCRITDTLLVRMFAEKKIYVPDYFTPNNDGKNDKLYPFLVGVTKLTRFRIWNRWGQLVFQTQKAEEGWDGYYQGVRQPMETYLWMAEGLDIDGKIIYANGSVVLVR